MIKTQSNTKSFDLYIAGYRAGELFAYSEGRQHRFDVLTDSDGVRFGRVTHVDGVPVKREAEGDLLALWNAEVQEYLAFLAQEEAEEAEERAREVAEDEYEHEQYMREVAAIR